MGELQPWNEEEGDDGSCTGTGWIYSSGTRQEKAKGKALTMIGDRAGGPPRVEIVPLYSVSALFRILSLVHKYTVLGVTQTQPWIDMYERTVDF
jgi:hypothetical protein